MNRALLKWLYSGLVAVALAPSGCVGEVGRDRHSEQFVGFVTWVAQTFAIEDDRYFDPYYLRVDNKELEKASLRALNREWSIIDGSRFSHDGSSVLISVRQVQQLEIVATNQMGAEVMPHGGALRYGAWVSLIRGPMSQRHFYIEAVHEEGAGWSLLWKSPEAGA